MFLIRLASPGAQIAECDKRNLRFFDFLVKMWRLPAQLRLILPLPVTLKRFFALECVFTFGMFKQILIKSKKSECKYRFLLVENRKKLLLNGKM